MCRIVGRPVLSWLSPCGVGGVGIVFSGCIRLLLRRLVIRRRCGILLVLVRILIGCWRIFLIRLLGRLLVRMLLELGMSRLLLVLLLFRIGGILSRGR